MDEIVGRRDVLSASQMGTVAVATRFLETLGRGDVEGLMTLWHTEGRLEFPFSPSGEEPVQGIERLRTYFEGTKSYKRPRAFPIRHIYPCADSEWVVVEFHGDLVNVQTGEAYTNEYIVVVQVRDGKVLLFREFFDALKRQRYQDSTG